LRGGGDGFAAAAIRGGGMHERSRWRSALANSALSAALSAERKVRPSMKQAS